MKKTTLLKPPIPRMGGKSKLRKQIIKMIPQHELYVEPFLGAGWVYFGKEESKVEVINDIDQNITNLFKVIKYHNEEFCRLMEYEIYARTSFNEHKSTEGMTDIQKAIAFLCNIKMSFASRGGHFGYSFNSIPTRFIDSELIFKIKQRLKNTYIENLSFDKIIEKYNKENAFFFLDPPYYETAGYDTPFGEENYLILRDLLSNLKGKFLLTLNDHEQVREWFASYNLIETNVLYSASKKGNIKANELIIRNY